MYLVFFLGVYLYIPLALYFVVFVLFYSSGRPTCVGRGQEGSACVHNFFTLNHQDSLALSLNRIKDAL